MPTEKQEMGYDNPQQPWPPGLSQPHEGPGHKECESALGGRYHLHTDPCFVYLAVILDAFSRKAIGYTLSKRLDTELALGALQMAICDRHPKPGCIHHSDRGVQYASREYVKELKFYGFQISMSRRLTPMRMPMLRALSNPLSPRRSSCGSTVPWKMSRKGFPILSRTCITRSDSTPLLAIDLLVSLKLW